MLAFEGVSKAYTSDNYALRDLDLAIEDGELVVLIGPSGCGKTTTLRMVNRMVEPTKGSIRLDSKPLSSYDPVALRRGIGYVVQQIGLFPHMTIAENIQVVPKLLKWPQERRRLRTDELLHMVGMDPGQFAARYPHELSGGQQQRVGVLRALAADPKIILMDEPFGALDPLTREQLQDELKHLQQTVRKTIVFVTHDMDEALRLADRIVILRKGVLLQVGTPEEILRAPADDFVASFVGKHRLSDTLLPRTVADVMNRKPVVASKDTSVEKAFAEMQRRRVDTLLVVDEGGALQGYISAWHLVGKDLSHGTLSDFIETDLAVASPDEEAAAAFERMDSGHHGYLAVVEEGKLRGIVTRGSMTRALAAAVWGDDT